MSGLDRPDRWKHDLKNQLGIVLGFSALMLEELDPTIATLSPDSRSLGDL
jgi:hypothetical protein